MIKLLTHFSIESLNLINRSNNIFKHVNPWIRPFWKQRYSAVNFSVRGLLVKDFRIKMIHTCFQVYLEVYVLKKPLPLGRVNVVYYIVKNHLITIENALIQTKIWWMFETLDDLEMSIDQYIDYYNNKRIKSKLKGLTPVQYRNQSLNLLAN